MGVSHRHRGRSLGRRLLDQAGQNALASRFTCLTLAVDGKNVYAKRLYEQAGFVETMRRLAFVRTVRHICPK
jgi:ribosomal protein S18 acetylase RimI-like enzyme